MAKKYMKVEVVSFRTIKRDIYNFLGDNWQWIVVLLLIVSAYYLGKIHVYGQGGPEFDCPEIGMSADELCSMLGCRFGYGSVNDLNCYCDGEWMELGPDWEFIERRG